MQVPGVLSIEVVAAPESRVETVGEPCSWSLEYPVPGDLQSGETSRRMKLFTDPIVDEIRRIRERRAAEFDFDLGAIIEDAKKREAQSSGKVVSFARRSRPVPRKR